MKLFKWFLMLNKRLYKKITFVVLMVLIPVCVLVLMFAAGQESGFVKIVMAQHDGSDPISSAIVESFLNEKSLVLFVEADSPEAALETVESGQADAAWIFPEDMNEKINAFSGEENFREPVVSVVEREQTVFNRIAREKLAAALMKYCARAKFISFSRQNIPGSEAFDEETLIGYFEGVAIDQQLFAFDNADAEESTASQSNYLIAPIRGLLSVLICLGGAAAVLLYMQDEKKGVFSLVKEAQRPLVAFACVLIALLNLAVVVLAALLITGLATGIFTELLGILLYCICCALFCLLIKELVGSMRAYSVLLPLLAIALCAVCPVFFDFKKLALPAHLFPPTYYIHLLYDGRYLVYMPLYGVALLVLTILMRIATGKISFQINRKVDRKP